jgi:hypothetical protein
MINGCTTCGVKITINWKSHHLLLQCRNCSNMQFIEVPKMSINASTLNPSQKSLSSSRINQLSEILKQHEIPKFIIDFVIEELKKEKIKDNDEITHFMLCKILRKGGFHEN